MAEVAFTEVALLHIRALSAILPWVQPVVSVVWWKGAADNSRNANGGASWRIIEPPASNIAALVNFVKFVSFVHADRTSERHEASSATGNCQWCAAENCLKTIVTPGYAISSDKCNADLLMCSVGRKCNPACLRFNSAKSRAAVEPRLGN